MSSGGLTEEQKKRIEENRLRALERRAARSTHSQQSAVLISAKHGNNSYTSSSHSRPTVGETSTSLSSLKNSSAPKQQTHFKPGESHRNDNHIVTSDDYELPTSLEFNLKSQCPMLRSSASTSDSLQGLNAFQNKISKFYRPARSPAAARKIASSCKASSKSSQICTQTLSFQLPSAPGVPQNSTKMPAFSKMEKAVKGNCVLISRERFTVLVPYQAQLIGIFKTIPSRSYDTKTSKWDFSLSDYDKLMSAASSLPPYITLEGLPKAVKSTFLKTTPGILKDLSSHDINLNSVDGKLVQALMPFQKEGVSFGIRQDGRVLIADDMGLGKTIQAICVASYYRIEWPLLVIAPSSLRVTWQQAFMKWLPSVDPQSINVVLTGKDNPTAGLINIISYDLLSKRLDDLKQKQFRVIIADESHFIKNHKASRTKTALPLLKSASRVILLSGTPALSRPLELYTQICAIQPTLFPRFHQFGIRYCAGQQNRFGWDFSGASNMEELQLLLEEKLMIRRLKKDVLCQLPSKRRQMVLMDPSLIKTQTLERAAKQVSIAKQKEQHGALLNYFCETCSAKIPAVRNYILDLLESGRKFLVFAHHKDMLDAICNCLRQKNYCFIRIDGSTPSASRQALCDRFQQDNECLVAVLSITAANTGLTLTEATAVVFAELFWNPGVTPVVQHFIAQLVEHRTGNAKVVGAFPFEALLQAEDRVYRIGQKNSVNIHYLVAKRTADDYLWPLIQTKLEVLGKAGLSEDELDAHCTFFQDPKQQTLFSFVESFMNESEDDVSATSHELFDTGASSSFNSSRDVSSGAGCFYPETKPEEPKKSRSKRDSRKRTNPEDDNSPSTGNSVTFALEGKFDWFDTMADEDLIGCDLQEEKAGVEEVLEVRPSRKRRR